MALCNKTAKNNNTTVTRNRRPVTDIYAYTSDTFNTCSRRPDEISRLVYKTKQQPAILQLQYRMLDSTANDK